MKKNKTIIIAEAGVNHNGNLKTAKLMIKAAALAKVDYIKFQTFSAEYLVTRNATKSEYQIKTTKKNESQLNMLKKLQFNKKQHKQILEYCKKNKVGFLSTPFDIKSIDMLSELRCKVFKISSGDINNLPFLEHLSKFAKTIFLSTGMATLKEINQAIKILKSNKIQKSNITVLHCTTEYPAPYDEIHLRAMKNIEKKFNIKVGYSDHSLGIEVPVAAVALGAKVIEKHFTLNKKQYGPDHKASINAEELKNMVKMIRNIEKSLGSKNKIITTSEKKNIPTVRKSIVSRKKIKKGEIFNLSNIAIKRPGSGISPMKWYKVLGKIAKKNFKEGELIKL